MPEEPLDYLVKQKRTAARNLEFYQIRKERLIISRFRKVPFGQVFKLTERQELLHQEELQLLENLIDTVTRRIGFIESQINSIRLDV
jgi:hypothetical protein